MILAAERGGTVSIAVVGNGGKWYVQLAAEGHDSGAAVVTLHENHAAALAKALEAAVLEIQARTVSL